MKLGKPHKIHLEFKFSKFHSMTHLRSIPRVTIPLTLFFWKNKNRKFYPTLIIVTINRMTSRFFFSDSSATNFSLTLSKARIRSESKKKKSRHSVNWRQIKKKERCSKRQREIKSSSTLAVILRSFEVRLNSEKFQNFHF